MTLFESQDFDVLFPALLAEVAGRQSMHHVNNQVSAVTHALELALVAAALLNEERFVDEAVAKVQAFMDQKFPQGAEDSQLGIKIQETLEEYSAENPIESSLSPTLSPVEQLEESVRQKGLAELGISSEKSGPQMPQVGEAEDGESEGEED